METKKMTAATKKSLARAACALALLLSLGGGMASAAPAPISIDQAREYAVAEAGVPLETISRRLGHSDGHTTRDVYFHVTKRMEEHDRRLLDTVQILQTSWVLLTFC